MIIGAHISTNGDIVAAVDRAVDIGAEAMQVFASRPRGWRFDAISEADAAAFRERNAAAGLAPPYLHAIYLVNLASVSPAVRTQSEISLGRYMELAARIGAAGVIVHPGYRHGYASVDGGAAVIDQIAFSIRRVMLNAPPGPLLCLETMTGASSRVGSFAELGAILRAVNSPRLAVCLDTQHAFAAGHDLSHHHGVLRTIKQFEQIIGLKHLAVIHANDSRTACGSRVHGHANIGSGRIGGDGFASLMGHPMLASVPMILETPGYCPERPGPCRRSVDTLKSIRRQLDCFLP